MVLPASGEGPRARRPGVIEDVDLARQIVEHGAVMRLGEKADDVGGHVLADAVDVDEPDARLAVGILCRLHLGAPMRERAVMAGEQPRRRLTDLRDAERVDKAFERDTPALVDPGDELSRADHAPAFALGDNFGVEAEDVARLMDQPVLPEGLDVLGSEPLDIERVAGDEMLQPLDRLGRADQAAGAAPRDHARLAHREAAAHRAMIRELVRLRVGRAALGDHADNLRDHVAGALHDDGVADAHVLARDLVLVVQGGALHDDPADRDRLEAATGVNAPWRPTEIRMSRNTVCACWAGICGRAPSAARG